MRAANMMITVKATRAPNTSKNMRMKVASECADTSGVPLVGVDR